MDNEQKEKVAELAVEAKKKAIGIWVKIVRLWKSGTKGKVICIVGVLVILGIIGAFTDDEEGGGGGGGDWTYTGKDFRSVFDGFPKDEGEVYFNDGAGKVMQATKKGNLVKGGSSDRVVWVETTRRYEDDERLDAGYYIRRGSMEYETALGAEKRVARYVQMSEKELHSKWQAVLAATGKALGKGKRAGDTKILKLPGGATMEMVWCPPGTFTIGSRDGAHQVTLTKGFWLAKTEVTQAQWKSVMGSNPSDHEGDGNLPVERVSWTECDAFCKRAGLELPTEAQWEYACRAGSTGEYAGTGRLEDMGWYDDNSDGQTHPVGQKQPNAWGFYDMHGNVEEWCADWFGDYPKGPVTDPKGPASGSRRVHRGGSWGGIGDGVIVCRSANRHYDYPSNTDDNLGFRPARGLSE